MGPGQCIRAERRTAVAPSIHGGPHPACASKRPGDRRTRLVPLRAGGEGEFPFGRMFAALAGIKFDGFVSFEWEKLWHPELASPEVALPNFIQWWKSREAA